MEIVEKEPEERVTIGVTESGDDANLGLVKVIRLDPGMIAKAQHEGHRQFWSDMGLGEFTALDWNCKTGSVPECREFILNSDKEFTTTARCIIDLREASLAKIFKLEEANAREASLRARQRQFQEFTSAKDKNGYKLSQCTDPALIE
ncbi:unnamed protein product [Calypogeia fissa]